jgi:hypothetical protein
LDFKILQMKFFLTFALLITTLQLYSQLQIRDSVIGTWLTTEVTFAEDKEFSGPELKKMQEITKIGFSESKFIFKADGMFNLVLPNATSDFAKGFSMNNAKWTFDSAKKAIFVGRDLMNIYLKEQNGNVYFLIDETPIVLKMRQIKN